MVEEVVGVVGVEAEVVVDDRDQSYTICWVYQFLIEVMYVYL